MDLTDDELVREYRKSVGDYRYYLNTDDLNNWKRETAERDATRKRMDELAAELKRRNIKVS